MRYNAHLIFKGVTGIQLQKAGEYACCRYSK